MTLKNSEALFKKLERFMLRKEWDAIIKCLPNFDITEIEMKRVGIEIKRWAISEKRMSQILWEIRNEIIEEDLKLFCCCYILDLKIEGYSRKIFVRFVHAQILRLIFKRR